MKVYTRTGDRGLTSIVGGERISKASPRIEAYGTVDELNSWLGLLIAEQECPDVQRRLMTEVQSRLFDIGGHLAGTPSAGIIPENIAALEADIDAMDSSLSPLTRFVLPGGSPLAAKANIARTVCRRAERLMVAVSDTVGLEPEPLVFINRLSDWLFVFSRFCNKNAGIEEKFWQKQ
ncbi:MAG: cob(I)yrinic acid a,c-diamide adenosyltransferase [Muribaculaceae bacterium]|nr:cob(I)yrinic acid a,c-diamide adenosyltransferase [Muribaculaceae bacterium]MDE7110295.1 cob(I)yrinic acid a,c-diamide adenosyltransferase [Muribaculaceae bacterium]